MSRPAEESTASVCRESSGCRVELWSPDAQGMHPWVFVKVHFQTCALEQDQTARDVLFSFHSSPGLFADQFEVQV